MGTKRRLYYGAALRAIRYSPAMYNDPAYFTAQITDSDYCVHFYKAPTIPEIIASIKADGWTVWGKDTLDYALPPNNALEYLLMEQALKAEGYTDSEIQEAFSLRDVAPQHTAAGDGSA